jgi:hypothetical protein
VAGGNVRAMQRLVSEALWDEATVRETYHRLGQEEMGEPDGVLIADDTGFGKRGPTPSALRGSTVARWAKWSIVKWTCLRRMPRGRAMR